MLPALVWDMRDRFVRMLVTLRCDLTELMFSWVWLRRPGGTLGGWGPASAASMDDKAGPVFSPSDTRRRSGDLLGSDGGGEALSSALFPTGVGGRRGGGLRLTGVLGMEATTGDRLADNGGRGGSGGNLEAVDGAYAGDLGGSSLIFLTRSITLRASALVAACRSAKRSASNESASV